MLKALPNILTIGRLILTLAMFVALAAAGGAVPYVSERLTPDTQFALIGFSFWAFVIAAITDYFDGWAARKFDAVTVLGKILDPIGDKILVAGGILGLMALGPQPWVVLPAGLILFREFSVSALREVGAGKGVQLPVTLLAKWKTTLQLVGLAGELLVAAWPAFDLPPGPAAPVAMAAHAIFWLAAVVTLITGWDYLTKTLKALKAP